MYLDVQATPWINQETKLYDRISERIMKSVCCCRCAHHVLFDVYVSGALSQLGIRCHSQNE